MPRAKSKKCTKNSDKQTKPTDYEQINIRPKMLSIAYILKKTRSGLDWNTGLYSAEAINLPLGKGRRKLKIVTQRRSQASQHLRCKTHIALQNIE